MVLRTLASLGPMHGYGITLHIEKVSKEVLRMEESLSVSSVPETASARITAFCPLFFSASSLRVSASRTWLHPKARSRQPFTPLMFFVRSADPSP